MTLTTHPDYLGLLAGVLEAPDDDAPRLVLADWLDENGDPERAEFIRVQVAMARKIDMALLPAQALLRRERELLTLYNVSLWAGPPLVEIVLNSAAKRFAWEGGPSEPVSFRRGFIGSLVCTAEAFLANADALLWRPGEACRECGGVGASKVPPSRATFFQLVLGQDDKETCPACLGTGHCPIPETAQPIESVTLTTPIHRFGESLSGHRMVAIVGRGFGYQMVSDDDDSDATMNQVKDLLAAEWPQIRRENWHLPGEA